MLSRHADAIYWLGRYMERAECTARMVDVHYHYRLERSVLAEETLWSGILAISGEEQRFLAQYGPELAEDERSILQFFCFESRNPSSILTSLAQARENARSIREQISTEMWECVNRAYLELSGTDLDKVMRRSPYTLFQAVKNHSHLLQGISERTLMEGEGRDFYNLGRFVERASQTTRVLDVKYHVLLPRFRDGQNPGEPSPLPEPDSVGGPVDVHGWIAVLRSVGGLEAFRKTHPAVADPTTIAGFILLNDRFPASVRYCANAAQRRIERLTQSTGIRQDNRARFASFQLCGRLASVRIEEVVKEGLHEFLKDQHDRFDELALLIAETFLQY